MGFGGRLLRLRTERGLSRAELARRAGISASHVARCETEVSQPTVEVLRNLTIALAVSADDLLFEPGERRHRTDRLSSLFAATQRLDKADRDAIRNHIEACLYRSQAEALRKARKKPGPRKTSPGTR